MRILVVDSTVWRPGGVIWEGYVYIDSSRVVAVGEGYPPPERQVAETLIGGRGRVVLPSPVAIILLPELYTVRYIVEDLAVLESRSLLEYFGKRREASYYSSLMAFYDAVANGFGEVVAVAYNPAEVAKALKDSGLSGVVLANNCPRHSFDPKALQELRVPGRIGVGVLTCTGEHVRGLDVIGFVEESSVRLESASHTITVARHINIHPLSITRLPSPWPHMSRVLGGSYEAARRLLLIDGFKLLHGAMPLDEGSPASITILDATEPPSLTVRGLDPLESVTHSCPRVETVISRGSIVVDGGQNLYVGSEAAGKAREVLSKAYGEIKTVL